MQEKETVFVVTGTDLGWSCVVGVFKGVTKRDLTKVFKDTRYVFHEQTVDTNLDAWRDDHEPLEG